jgi:hypothetical protein
VGTTARLLIGSQDYTREKAERLLPNAATHAQMIIDQHQ